MVHGGRRSREERRLRQKLLRRVPGETRPRPARLSPGFVKLNRFVPCPETHARRPAGQSWAGWNRKKPES